LHLILGREPGEKKAAAEGARPSVRGEYGLNPNVMDGVRKIERKVRYCSKRGVFD